MTYLADVNVWLALSYSEHIHNAAATAWFESALDHSSTSNELAFCRVTEMGFLRLLTNSTVMGSDVRTPAAAWTTLKAFYQDTRIQFATEPSGLRDAWQSLTRHHHHGVNFWTDAYLGAFATRAGYTLVTFDRGFERYTALSLKLLSR